MRAILPNFRKLRKLALGCLGQYRRLVGRFVAPLVTRGRRYAAAACALACKLKNRIML
jgi:hypothetical protein